MYFHTVLGVKKNAGLADIKRAYAVKIKQHRPEDDPEEFQRIHTAYQSAVAYAKTRNSETEITASACPSDDPDWNRMDDWLYYEDKDEPDRSETPSYIPTTEISAELLNIYSKKADWKGTDECRDNDSNEEKILKRTDNTDNIVPNTTTRIRNQSEHHDLELAKMNEIAAEHSGFNFKKFSEEFLDIASNRHATLNSWLENHPDLYDIELKHSLCLPVLELLDEIRPLAPKQLLDLLRFFNLDTVIGMGAQFSHEIENLKNKSANAHPWEDLSFIRAPREQYATTTESDFPWRIIWYGILASSIIIRALS